MGQTVAVHGPKKAGVVVIRREARVLRSDGGDSFAMAAGV